MGRMSMAIAMSKRNRIPVNLPPIDRSYARASNGRVCPTCLAEGAKCPRCKAEDVQTSRDREATS